MPLYDACTAAPSAPPKRHCGLPFLLITKVRKTLSQPPNTLYDDCFTMEEQTGPPPTPVGLYDDGLTMEEQTGPRPTPMGLYDDGFTTDPRAHCFPFLSLTTQFSLQSPRTMPPTTPQVADATGPCCRGPCFQLLTPLALEEDRHLQGVSAIAVFCPR